MRRALPDREFAIRAARWWRRWWPPSWCFAGAAQVLPPGLPLAAALLGVLLVPGLACARIWAWTSSWRLRCCWRGDPAGLRRWSLGLMAR
jgi:hypothetical protein